MDKKNIRHTWIGNMYQKFEAVCQDVCQDVEEFVNKDHVKYVENHMQTVGESVKKFYNGVVQDLILPPLIENYTNSVTVKENTIHHNTNKSQQSPLISVTHCRKLSPTCEIIKSPVQEAKNPNSEHECNDVIKKNIPNTIDNNTNKSEEGPLNSTETCHKKSPTCEIIKSPVQEEEDTNPNFHHEVDDVIKKNIPNSIDNNASNLEEGASNSTEDCHEKSPTCEIIKSPVQEEDTNPNFEHEGDDVINNTSFNERGMLHNSVLEDTDSVFEDEDWGIENIIDLNLDMDKKIEGGQMSFPFIKDESEKVRVETLFKDFEFFLKIQESNETERLINENQEEKSCDVISPTKSSDSSSTDYISSSSHDLSSCESFTSTKFPSSDFALYDGSNELDGSMGEFEDINMDTIDLSDKEELVESGVIVEGKNVFSFQYGPKRGKSYKKIIRDAFMSRKKLAKEYEQLAIWCGDIEKEFSKQKEKNATKLHQVQDFPDSEWEIL